eukprot:Hpha_TRINITY_DN16579_c0_g2::TRINITY_DN16579_c0_g2_i1::g.133492::m.133492
MGSAPKMVVADEETPLVKRSSSRLMDLPIKDDSPRVGLVCLLGGLSFMHHAWATSVHTSDVPPHWTSGSPTLAAACLGAVFAACGGPQAGMELRGLQIAAGLFTVSVAAALAMAVYAGDSPQAALTALKAPLEWILWGDMGTRTRTISSVGALAAAALLSPHCFAIMAPGRWTKWWTPLVLLYTLTILDALADLTGAFLTYPFPAVASLYTATRVPSVLFGQIVAGKVLQGGGEYKLWAVAFVLAVVVAFVLLLELPIRMRVVEAVLLPAYGVVAAGAAVSGSRVPLGLDRLWYVAGELALQVTLWHPVTASVGASGWGSVVFTLLAAGLSVVVCRKVTWAVGKCYGTSSPDHDHAVAVTAQTGLIGGDNRAQIPAPLRLMTYYMIMIGFIGLFVTAGILQGRNSGFHPVSQTSTLFDVASALRWGTFVSVPTLLMGLLTHIFIPAVMFTGEPVPVEGYPPRELRGRLFVRIVTRGNAPLLVQETVEKAEELCMEVPCHDGWFVVEVVTDKAMEEVPESKQVVVPTAYQCPRGGKFKSRALHYAIDAERHASVARPGEDDWVVHLDEESRMSKESLRHALWHIYFEEERGAPLPRIGQGPILYGSRGAEVENWFTTLADSGRVGDDFGKFRLAASLNCPIFGMHGSFIIISQKVQQAIGWDHGPEGSVTEDVAFAIEGWSKGVGISWIDAFMHEQSPFTVHDFLKQRKRWFAGLVRLFFGRTWCSSWIRALPLRVMIAFFSLSFLSAPFTSAAVFLTQSMNDPEYRAGLMACAAIWTWNYSLGFLITYRPSSVGGVVRWGVLGSLQLALCTLFLVCEVAGSLWALVDASAFEGFYVVQKQNTALRKRWDSRTVEAP